MSVCCGGVAHSTELLAVLDDWLWQRHGRPCKAHPAAPVAGSSQLRSHEVPWVPKHCLDSLVVTKEIRQILQSSWIEIALFSIHVLIIESCRRRLLYHIHNGLPHWTVIKFTGLHECIGPIRLDSLH